MNGFGICHIIDTNGRVRKRDMHTPGSLRLAGQRRARGPALSTRPWVQFACHLVNRPGAGAYFL
jgi:hypothetical protein